MRFRCASEKPRVLVLASTYPRWVGDPEPGFVHELSKRLADQFDVTVLCPHSKDAATQDHMDGVNVRRFRYAPSNVETLVNNGGIVGNLKRSPWKWLLVPGFLCAMTWCAMREVRKQRPDVIHAHWLIPQGVVAALLQLVTRKPIPFLVTSHGADLFALRAPPLRAVKRWVAKRAAAMTVVSHAMRDELDRIGVDTANVHVQPMGVDLTTRFTPDPSIERSGDEILFVGRLVEKKGLRYLIDAMPQILQQHPAASLTIAGFGPEEFDRKAQVSALGLESNVRFIGAVSQRSLPDLYRRAAVFAAPFVVAADGDQEGLGLVTLEAMGCDCPAVVGMVPATAALGVTPPFLQRVDAGDSQQLANALLRCLGNRVATSAESRSRMIEVHDWQSRANEYASILSAVAEQGRQ